MARIRQSPAALGYERKKAWNADDSLLLRDKDVKYIDDCECNHHVLHLDFAEADIGKSIAFEKGFELWQ